MALEDNIEVPSTSNSSFNNDFNDYCHDNNDDDETCIVSKLMSKCKSLLSKKNYYKHELTSLTKEFENLKNEFSSLILSNAKLVNDLKNSNSLEDQLKKANDENQKLSKEVLDLKNSIDKLMKGKETLNSILDSQKLHGDVHGIGYSNGTASSSSSHINFIKAHNAMSFTSKNETQTFKTKRSHMSNNKRMSHKTQTSLTQRDKAQTKAPQPKHAYMYTRHNLSRPEPKRARDRH